MACNRDIFAFIQFPCPGILYGLIWNIRAQRLASVQHNDQQHCGTPGQQLTRMGTRSLATANHRDQLLRRKRVLFNYTGSGSEISIGRLIIANCGHNGPICKANMRLVGLSASASLGRLAALPERLFRAKVCLFVPPTVVQVAVSCVVIKMHDLC
jgi:hypothetical protein